jgi:hypothetical protein
VPLICNIFANFDNTYIVIKIIGQNDFFENQKTIDFNMFYCADYNLIIDAKDNSKNLNLVLDDVKDLITGLI